MALYTGTNKPFTVQLHSGRCYTKIRGNGFRLLTQTKISLASIGGNREPRRATTDVHSLPILLHTSSSPISRRACALSFSFSTSLSVHFFFFLSSFLLYGVYISLYMHFGVKGLKRNINGRKAGLETTGFCFLLHYQIWYAMERSLSLGACRVWVDYARQL